MATVQVRQVAVSGDLKSRMDSMIEWELTGRCACGFNDHWMVNDLEHSLPAPRTSEDFTGDVWGAYIETMAVLSRITRARYHEVDGVVRKVLEYQRPDGAFWNVVPDEKDIPQVVSDNRAWGWQRALIGFVEYYLTFGDEKVLAAARRLGEFLLAMYEQSRHVPPESPMARTMRGSAWYPPSSYWSAVTQGFVRLFQITGEKRYLAVATEIADRVPDELLDVENTTDWLAWHGVMLLYEHTRDQRYLRKVQKNVGDVMRMMTVLGNTPHLWHFPKSNEACGLADSITLHCDLWRATLDPSYMDAVERIAYNAFFASLYPRSGCGRYNYEPRVMQPRHVDPQEESGVRDCFVHVYKCGVESCCSWHVPIAFRDIIEHICYAGRESDVYINLFVPSRVELAVEHDGASTPVLLEQETEYPHGEAVSLRLRAGSPVHLPLRIRIPYWCDDASVSINGEKAMIAPAGKYVSLDRQWHHDDIRLKLPMPIRMEAADPPWRREAETSGDGTCRRAVLLKGPVVLVLDKDDNPNISPLWQDAHIGGVRSVLVAPVGDGRMSVELPHDGTRIASGDQFRYPQSHYQGIWELVDGRKRVKGHLSPFAEVTAAENPSWVQYVFAVRRLAAEQYREYANLLEDGGFEMTDEYRRLLAEVRATDVWMPPLLDCCEKNVRSYDAVLAARRLGKSRDERAIKALIRCLETNYTLMQRMAVVSIRELGIANEEVARALRTLAERVPELRSTVQETLAALGLPIIPGRFAGRSMSWIEGPNDAEQYLLRRALELKRRDVKEVDLRISSWDIYEVLFNGAVVGLKPTWANVKFIELTPRARPEHNELIVRVIRRPRLPERFIETWTVGSTRLPPGVIAKLRVQYAGDEEDVLYSDGSWEVAPLPPGAAFRRGNREMDPLRWTVPTATPHEGGNPFSYS